MQQLSADLGPFFEVSTPSRSLGPLKLIIIIIMIIVIIMMMTRISLSEIKDHDWVTMYGLNPLLKEEENCQLIEVSLEKLIELRQNFRNIRNYF